MQSFDIPVYFILCMILFGIIEFRIAETFRVIDFFSLNIGKRSSVLVCLIDVYI